MSYITLYCVISPYIRLSLCPVSKFEKFWGTSWPGEGQAAPCCLRHFLEICLLRRLLARLWLLNLESMNNKSEWASEMKHKWNQFKVGNQRLGSVVWFASFLKTPSFVIFKFYCSFPLEMAIGQSVPGGHSWRVPHWQLAGRHVWHRRNSPTGTLDVDIIRHRSPSQKASQNTWPSGVQPKQNLDWRRCLKPFKSSVNTSRQGCGRVA